jgi:hemerythrin superfamily protein
MLRADHERVKDLFQDFEQASTERQSIAEKVFMELEMHAKLEEKIFYPALRGKTDKKGEELLNEAFEEHRKVKTLIQELKSLDTDEEEFERKFQDLMSTVLHHVEEEESEIFPKAEDDLMETSRTWARKWTASNSNSWKRLIQGVS